eukprot:173321_1
MGNNQQTETTQTITKWLQLKHLPGYARFDRTCVSTSGDIITIGQKRLGSGWGVWIYDKITNEWKLLAESNTIQPSSKYSDAMAFDNNNHLHTIQNIDNQCMWNMITVNNNKVKKLSTPYHFQTTTGGPLLDNAMRGIVINGSYHILTTVMYTPGLNVEHWVPNQKSKTFDRIHAFDCMTALDKCALIYIPYKNELYLLGGRYYDEVACLYRAQKSIWIYSLETTKWRLSNVQLPIALELFGCVLTNNQQYIIMFGGGSNDENNNYVEYESDRIYIMHTKSMQITESKMKCPTEGNFHAINYSEQHKKSDLIIGWFLRGCQGVVINAKDVIQIIKQYYDYEYIHLFRCDGSGKPQLHWKILSGILFT